MKLACVLGGLAALLSVLAVEAPARAADADRTTDGEPAPRSVEVSPMFGYASNGYGAGAGLRAGYTFKNGAWAGASVTYHSGGLALSPGENWKHAIVYPAAELGWDFRRDAVSFRPYVGAGAGFMSRRTDAGSTSETIVVAYPGASLMVRPETSVLFAGVDARLFVPFASGAKLTDLSSAAMFLVAGLQL